MRTITLELLRHGPPHNQLLSPLTPYLALCENHAAVTVQLTFEHNQFLHRLRALSYRLGEEARVFQLRDTAVTLGALLAGVPGLTAELSRQGEDADSHTHIRLIVSASELALLPFELALAPNGFPGAGQQILLQNALPLSLTREVRRVQDVHLNWPRRPKILFIAASPPGAGVVPLESHLLALRQAIDPWVKYYDEADDTARRRRVSEHIALLPRASISDIETACASGEYTHIHILAHGIEWQDGYDVRYGLALHDSLDPEHGLDRVSGARLASALRPIRRGDPRGLASPAVVTLASCNSGAVGSVAGAGASIAHSLHEAGIPLVIGSQFPLSFPGSVAMVETLYGGLLWGQDPRILVSDLRRQLHSMYPESHDWASIAAYASLSSGFEAQLETVQLDRVMDHINTAMNHADEATKVASRHRHDNVETGSHTDMVRLLGQAKDRLERARLRLENLLQPGSAQHVKVLGLLASTEKRQAGVLHETSSSGEVSQDSHEQDRAESRRLLERARDHYWQTFRLDRTRCWSIVQYLSLDLVLRHWTKTAQTAPSRRAERDPTDLWTLAHILSTQDLSSSDPDKVVVALGNLVELQVLAMFDDIREKRQITLAFAAAEAQEHAHTLIGKAGADSFVVYSLRRQLLRYKYWYDEVHDLGEVAELAKTLADGLPATVKEDWD